MKKRCTNSACRKTFEAFGTIISCPHCGKQYPRFCSFPAKSYAVILISYGSHKLRTIKAVRDIGLEHHCRIGLRNIKELTEAAPSLATIAYSQKDAVHFVQMIAEGGGTAKMIPLKKLKKRNIFIHKEVFPNL